MDLAPLLQRLQEETRRFNLPLPETTEPGLLRSHRRERRFHGREARRLAREATAAGYLRSDIRTAVYRGAEQARLEGAEA